ncbi:MAG TPA: carboxypeptidase-like regulatory domain-containing protein, partial [Anaerolineaceae bacterium]|nr:carboxypeptidase-like regulatory domain-containing protein [Anaerolineaceae bacterium]
MIIKRKIKIFLVSFFFVLMLNLVGCGLNIQPKGVNQPVPLPRIPSKISKVEQTLVKFLVQTPFTDFENVEIALDLLDDLSGYHDNIRRYPMKDIGDNRFEVSVLLDNQFDVRYRYTMISPAEVPETNLYGKTVDFRMAIVEPDLIVSDTVFNWANSNLGLAIGHLNGFMIDHQTQAGIPDMMINIAGMQTFTDMTGYFSFEKIPVGEYNLVAYAVDGHYPPLQQMTVIAEGQTTKIDVSLQPLKKVTVHFQVTPSSETVGVPIRLAGNFVGLGAHYGSDFITSGSAASLMPLLDQVDSDIYMIDLELY